MHPTRSTILLLTLAASLAAQQATAPAGPATPSTDQQTPQDPLTAAWADALSEAKQWKAPLLVFVLPDDGPADETKVKALRDAEVAAGMLVRASKTAIEPPPIVTRRDLMLRQVQLLRALGTAGGFGRGGLQPGNLTVTDAQRLFALTVQVIAPPKLCGAKPGETVVVLRADGKRLAGCDVDLTDHEAFVRALTPPLLAPEVLDARAATVEPELREAYASLIGALRGDPPDWAAIERLCGQLRKNLPAAAPAIVREQGTQLDSSLASQLFEPRPPHGAQEQMVLTGDPCPACGMAYVPMHLNSVLKLLGP